MIREIYSEAEYDYNDYDNEGDYESYDPMHGMFDAERGFVMMDDGGRANKVSCHHCILR